MKGIFYASFTFLLSPIARAATIDVTTTSDEIKLGDCSLREAIIAANTDTATTGCPAGSGSDVINIPAGTYTLYMGGTDEDAAATGDLDITGDVTLTGAGETTTIINGNGIDRVFQIIHANVMITNLQITGGRTAADDGGGIYAGPYSTVTLTGSTISGSTSGEYYGGGISAYGYSTVMLNQTTVSGNTAGPGGSGIFASSSTVTLTGSTVSGNTATEGTGGIYAYNSSTVTLTDSTISGNQASHDGGGISASDSTVTLTNSTISGNQASENGGGIYAVAGSTITMNHSTVSGNTVDGDSSSGGGIYAYSSIATLTNSTISGNQASHDGGGISAYASATVGLYNVTLANNTAGAGGGGIYGNGFYVRNTLIADNSSDCAGTIDYLTYSLITDTTNCTITSGTAITGPAYLSPLGNYGGTTQTHKPKPISPAIDGGDPSGCKTASGHTINKDQRGHPRHFDGNGDGTAVCDMGAYEKSL